MDSYSIFYGLSILGSLFIGQKIFSQYRNTSGFFFFLFTIFASLWYTLYYIFFSGIGDPSILLYLSRIDFITGILSVYSLLFALKYFHTEKENKHKREIIFILCSYLIGAFLYICTPLIIEGLSYDTTKSVYREIYGSGYLINMFLYGTFLGLFIFYSYKQVGQQSGLSKIRIKNLIFATFVFLFTLIFLQVILPYYGIWILEKEIVFLFLFFSIFSYYTFRRYYFTSLGYGIGKSLVIIVSIGLVMSCILFFREYPGKIGTGSYWEWDHSFSWISIIIGILLYQGIHQFLYKHILGKSEGGNLKRSLEILSEHIINITDTKELSSYLGKEIFKILKVKECFLYQYKIDENSEYKRYFESSKSEKIFINDIVFLEKNRESFDSKKILQETPKNIFLSLPLTDTNKKNIGVLFLGNKPFGEFYTAKEIKILREFTFFLGLHLKYIEMYQKIEDLSINLDKKIDEKTIEFNDLINKQKEFIGMISHEIKTPISSAIFQADSIIDDIKDGTIGTKEVKTEVQLLQDQLVKVGDLMNKLFSVQYYDTRSITLFRERIDMEDFIKQEFKIFQKIYPKTQFELYISDTIGFLWIDRIQFQQILGNIISNTQKQFQNRKNPKVIMSVKIKENIFSISIEDNGAGFSGIQPEEVFDRYKTGGGGMAGLGLGLYLCKVIVEMHDGNIEAKISQKLGGALFEISLPLHS